MIERSPGVWRLLVTTDPDPLTGQRRRVSRSVRGSRSDAVCPGLWSRIDEEKRGRYRANAPMLFADLQGPPLDITTADLPVIAIPALVLAGDSSHPALHATAQTLADHLPDVRYLEFEDCGHVTYAEQPEAFAHAVATFADELEHQPAAQT